MLQIIVGLLCIYIGLSISFEQLVKYFFHYSEVDLSKEDVGLLGKIINYLDKSKYIISLIGFIIGIVIFVAPTPTLQVVESPVPHIQNVTQRFFGDLMPALLLMVSSIVLNNKIISFFNFKNENFISRFISIINTYGFWIGILTIIFGFLHLILGNSIFL